LSKQVRNNIGRPVRVKMDRKRESRNLDLLRSAAVLFVVIFHILLFFQLTRPGRLNLHQMGHWGVLLFFIHTSLVLMFSMERQTYEASERGLFIPFYVRRIFRIFPLSILVVLTVYLCHLPVAHLHDGVFQAVGMNIRELLSNLFLVQNITHTESIIAPLWSLPYEIQMYLVLPLLFLIARASRNIYVVAGCWAMTVIAATVAMRVPRLHIPDLMTYVPCFMAGVLAYKLTKSPSWKLPFALWPVTLAGVTAFYFYDSSEASGWFCCLLVALLLPQFREMGAGAFSRVCHEIARYSYGVYLTHFIAIWFAFAFLQSIPMAVRWMIFLLILVIVPVVLYHTVEAPMITMGHRLLARQKASPQPVSAVS
jgi:peptidoglycan/LPS O-acetylase OafA/YrhL